MDTCGYIAEICNGDFRNLATKEQRVIFYEPIINVIQDYERYFGNKKTASAATETVKREKLFSCSL